MKLSFTAILILFSMPIFCQIENSELADELNEKVKQERYNLNEIACQNTNFQNISELLLRWKESEIGLDTIESILKSTFYYHNLRQLDYDSILVKMLSKEPISKIANYFLNEDLEVLNENSIFITLLCEELTILEFDKLLRTPDYGYHCLDTFARVHYRRGNFHMLNDLLFWDILDNDNILYIPSQIEVGIKGYLLKEIYPNLHLYIWKKEAFHQEAIDLFREIDSFKYGYNNQYKFIDYPEADIKKLDKVIINGSFHHLDEPKNLLGHIKSNLNVNGELIIEEWTSDVPGFNHCEKSLSSDEITTLLQECGFFEVDDRSIFENSIVDQNNIKYLRKVYIIDQD